MLSQHRKWTREETIIALYMFCTIQFNECSARHPLIYEVANLIGRTPAALNMKVGNMGRFDSTLAARGITGLRNGSALDKEIWDEFNGDFGALGLKSEEILSRLRNGNNQINLPLGEEVERTIHQRVNQDFFRRIVLSSYNYKCCITGICNPELLEACHISDWSSDEKNRTNPHNGLALTPTLHKAYDTMLIGVSPDFIVNVSERFFDNSTMTKSTVEFFHKINGTKISLPDRFAPSKELLNIHYKKYLQHL